MIPDKAKKFIVKEESFQRVGKLPSNGFSESYLCEDNETKRKVVLKYATTCSASACQLNGSANFAFYSKLSKFANVMHPSICPIECFTTPNKSRIPIIVSTYCKNGSLNKSAITRLNQSKKWMVAIGLAAAVKHLHSQGIFNLNLKLSNILLDENDHPFITDYWLPSFSKFTSAQTQNIGTILYKAPECLTKSSPVSEKSDIYSLGIILYHLFTSQCAYNDMANPLSQALKFARGYRPRIPDEMPPSVTKLITSCWDQNPDVRPTAAAVFDMILSSVRDAIDSLDKNIAVPYLRSILDFEYGTALSSFGDARGAFSAAKVLYNATDAPHIRERCMEDIKVIAEAGERDAKIFYAKITGENIGGDVNDNDGIIVQLKREKHHHHSKTTLPSVMNKDIVDAAIEGDREKLRSLLADNVSINSQNDDGETALIAATKKGDITLVQVILATDEINPNIANKKGFTALHEACKLGAIDIVQTLVLAKDIDVNAKDKLGYGPLEWAEKHELKNILLKAGAKPAQKKSSSSKKKIHSSHKK